MAVKKEALEKEKTAETNVIPKTTKKISTGSTKKMVQKRSSSLAGKKTTQKQTTQKATKSKEKKGNDILEAKEVVKPIEKKEKTTAKEKKAKKETEKQEVVKKETAKKEKIKKEAGKKETPKKEEIKKEDKKEEKIEKVKEKPKKENVKKEPKKKAKKEDIQDSSFEIENEENKKEQIEEKDIKKENKTEKKEIADKQTENKLKEEEIKEEPKKETKQLSLKEMAEIQAVIAKEMKANKKLPEIEFQKMSTRIFQNICLAISVMCYLNFVILGFINIENSVFVTDLKVFSVAILVIAIGIIEYAYKKESGRHIVHGIEILILSVITISLIYLNLMVADKFIAITVLITYIFSIYYILKAILVFRKMKKKYFMENMREIIRK